MFVALTGSIVGKGVHILDVKMISKLCLLYFLVVRASLTRYKEHKRKRKY